MEQEQPTIRLAKELLEQPKQEAQKAYEDLKSGKCTINEIRARYGLSKIKNGDMHLVPKPD